MSTHSASSRLETVAKFAAKKTPTTTPDDSQEAPITTIKKSTCKTLQGTATLTYHIGLDDTSALHWKIAASSGKSVNTPAFLLATLVKEGILAPVPDKKRHYQLGDAKPFLAEMDKLMTTDSGTGKAKPLAKAKAATRMSKGKAKPATGE